MAFQERPASRLLQVELARTEYQLPRLTRMWQHLERQAGGRVRGMGEKQIEVDRRLLRDRRDQLKRAIEDVRAHRRQYRKRRQEVLPWHVVLWEPCMCVVMLLVRDEHAQVVLAEPALGEAAMRCCYVYDRPPQKGHAWEHTACTTCMRLCAPCILLVELAAQVPCVSRRARAAFSSLNLLGCQQIAPGPSCRW